VTSLGLVGFKLNTSKTKINPAVPCTQVRALTHIIMCKQYHTHERKNARVIEKWAEGQLRSSQLSVSPTSPLSGASPGFRLAKPTAQQLHANSNSEAKGEHIQTLHVYTKNAGLHNDDGFGELIAEIEGVQWDIVMFNERRSSHGIIELQ